MLHKSDSIQETVDCIFNAMKNFFCARFAKARNLRLVAADLQIARQTCDHLPVKRCNNSLINQLSGLAYNRSYRPLVFTLIKLRSG